MKAFVLASSALLLAAAPAFAQDGAMKICGEKWQAAKASGTTGGVTWPKFLAECRTGLASAAPAAPASTPAVVPVVPLPNKPVMDQPEGKAKAAGTPVFPQAVSAKFADLRPAQARQKTCSEQYQANKATGGNGGLNWLEKGGGYWSLCNKKLKGA